MVGASLLALPAIAATIVRRVSVPVLIGLRWRALLVARHFPHRRRRGLWLALRLGLGLCLEWRLRRNGARRFTRHRRGSLRLWLASLEGLTILRWLAMSIHPLFALNGSRCLHFAHCRGRLAIALIPRGGSRHCLRWTVVGARRTGLRSAVLAILGIRSAPTILRRMTWLRRDFAPCPLAGWRRDDGGLLHVLGRLPSGLWLPIAFHWALPCSCGRLL